MDKNSSFKVGALDLNPVQRLLLLFFLFICYHKSWERVIKMEDNTLFEEEIMLPSPCSKRERDSLEAAKWKRELGSNRPRFLNSLLTSHRAP